MTRPATATTQHPTPATTILLERITRCRSLPSFPSVLLEVLSATSREDADLPKLAEIVSRDAGLVARILRTVNSSQSGLRHRITSIAQALPILGLRNLRTLVMGLAVIPSMKKCRPPVLDHVACCRRSLYSATAARLWAEQLKNVDSDQCFLTALLMDIGVLALAEATGEEYGTVLKRAERHADLESLERKSLGLSHAEVGSVLAQKWHLPDNLIEPIRFHHDPGAAPDGPGRANARVARIAGLCADIFVEQNPLWPISECYRLGAEDFGFDRVAVDAILNQAAAETKRLGGAFDVRVDESATFSRTQRQAGEELSANVSQEPRDPHTGSEQRRETRVPKTGTIGVFPCNGQKLGRPCRATLCNASPSGIGLLLPNAVDPNSRFVIPLRRGAGRLTIVVYKVLHCRPEHGAFLVGAELVRAIRNAETGAPGGLTRSPAPAGHLMGIGPPATLAATGSSSEGSIGLSV